MKARAKEEGELFWVGERRVSLSKRKGAQQLSLSCLAIFKKDRFSPQSPGPAAPAAKAAAAALAAAAAKAAAAAAGGREQHGRERRVQSGEIK